MDPVVPWERSRDDHESGIGTEAGRERKRGRGYWIEVNHLRTGRCEEDAIPECGMRDPRPARPLISLLLALFCLVMPGQAFAGGEPMQRREGPVIFHYWPGSERLADRLITRLHAMSPLPALPENILEQAGPVHVFLAPDAARFDSLTLGHAPEWGAGIAFPEARIIVLPGYMSRRAAPHELARILRHELAHVALHHYLAPARPPRWFDEGFARWAAGEWDWEAVWQLRLAFALNKAPPLDSIELAWPEAEGDARIAYLLATSSIAFLTDRSGTEGLRLFLDRWKTSGSLEPALRRTYGLTLDQFEEDWRKEVKGRYGWALVASHSLVFWLPAGLLLLLLFGKRRRRVLDRMEQLRADDPPDTPAYWLEEEAHDINPPPQDGERA